MIEMHPLHTDMLAWVHSRGMLLAVSESFDMSRRGNAGSSRNVMHHAIPMILSALSGSSKALGYMLLWAVDAT